MRDIYSVIVTHDFSKVSDESLAESRNIYGDAGMAINHAMQVIGNLLLEVDGSEEYSCDDAKRDLHLIGTVLRHLPRLSEALAQNERSAEFELRKRQGGGK
ncbi:Uncharacterised protein [Serratia ficaria]|uniref:hypothetical protein n=1 Tax=Serratia ficaria TaxID=61651 RepID=UPI0021C4CCC3|nr:hypothetical protein [Serratia ficaria]CAI2793401.1 Uncharacterised protein [Serratia ficaria]